MNKMKNRTFSKHVWEEAIGASSETRRLKSQPNIEGLFTCPVSRCESENFHSLNTRENKHTLPQRTKTTTMPMLHKTYKIGVNFKGWLLVEEVNQKLKPTKYYPCFRNILNFAAKMFLLHVTF